MPLELIPVLFLTAFLTIAWLRMHPDVALDLLYRAERYAAEAEEKAEREKRRKAREQAARSRA